MVVLLTNLFSFKLIICYNQNTGKSFRKYIGYLRSYTLFTNHNVSGPIVKQWGRFICHNVTDIKLFSQLQCLNTSCTNFVFHISDD